MPSAKTECTELSVGFGLLKRDPINVDPDDAQKLWDGSLDQATFLNFIEEYQKNPAYYRKFYNIGVNLALSHKVLARLKINLVRWEGPRQQARSVLLPKDIVVANVSISIKAESNVLANKSPYFFFVSLPNGLSNRTRSNNWYLEMDKEAYQNLYALVLDNSEVNFPLNVSDYHRLIKGKENREVLSGIIEDFPLETKCEFDKLYVNLCRVIAIKSAERFNSSLSRLDSSMRNGVFESVMRNFFRMSDAEYILCGLDNRQGFAINIPDLTSWKRKWHLKQITASPDLAREQSVVNFKLIFEDKHTKIETGVIFHSEIRWSHKKFNGNPEAKLYKEFKWRNLPFFEEVNTCRVQKFELIGSGGFGNVYRAKIVTSGDIVALKEFSAQGNENDRLRFEREVKIQQRLNHPNILNILLSDLSARIPWFVSPLARCNLAEIIPEISTDATRTSNIFRQILLGLIYAHGEKIIHRDIKPENILVFENDHIKIGDFGLGKELKTDTKGLMLTQSSDNAFGTCPYAAPEQFESFKDVDYRADIYALGKTLYNIVTGECPPPFYSHLLFDKIEAKYRGFIGKCTEKEPFNRYQIIQQALEVFDSIK